MSHEIVIVLRIKKARRKSMKNKLVVVNTNELITNIPATFKTEEEFINFLDKEAAAVLNGTVETYDWDSFAQEINLELQGLLYQGI